MNKWLKFSESVEYEVVDGHMAMFNSVSIQLLYRVRDLIKNNDGATKLLAHIFTDKSRDVNTTQTSTGEGHQQIVVEAISPNLAALRTKDLELGIAGLKNLIVSQESQELIAEFIYEASKDEWKEYGNFEGAREVIMALPIPVFLGFTVGSLKAQSGSVKFLGKLFPQIQKSTVEKLSRALEGLGD